MTKAFPIALMVAAGFASGAQAADLLSIYRDAVANDAQFASARAQLEAGRERVPQARAGLLPAVTLGANTTWNDTDTSFRNSVANPFVMGGSRTFNTNGFQVTLTQPVFRWQSYIQYGQAKLQVIQSEAVFAQARQDLILRVTQAYFDVLLSQDTLNLARSQKVAISEQLEAAKRNFEVGTATITDTHEAQARYDLANSQEIAAANDLEIRLQTLRQIIGRQPDVLRPLNPKVDLLPPQPNDMSRWVEAAEQGNFQVQAAQAGYEIAAKEVDRQRAAHLPTVDAIATTGNSGAGASATSSLGVDTRANTIGLQLAIPLYSGGAIVSRTNEAVALRERSLADLDFARRTAALNARQAFLNVTNGLAQVKALQQALISSESALESNRLGYEVGVRINIDVLNAQQQVYSTRRDLASARYNTLLAQLRLRAAASTLDEGEVQRVNELLGQ